MNVKSCVVFILLHFTVLAQYRGNRCFEQRTKERGRCILIHKCPSAIELVQRNIHPQLCGFAGRHPIVCCSRNAQIVTGPTNSPIQEVSKSEQKCQEYTNSAANDELQPSITVVGGTRSSATEFPHMAALGFGDEINIQWLCGGTLISENFVLTAAHCLFAPDIGDVKYVRLGDFNLKIVTDDAQPQTFEVISTYKHPDYKPPEQYNDIGLVQFNRPALFTKYVKPACLYSNLTLPANLSPIATGWGRLQYVGETSDELMKVTLSYFSNEQCANVYANVPQRRLPNGIVDTTQICAGGLNESKDTCQGDSGGPLQIKTADSPKQYYVIGITSFGKGCGVVNTPGVYTRVSAYIKWIEQIVWPTS